MTTRRHFRPSGLEALENRLVLSQSAFTLPAQVQDARLVQREFNTFARAYNQDVQTILLQAGTDGTVNPAANRAAFDAKVGADLATLDAAIANDTKNLVTPADLATTIHNELVGTDANSLQSRLTGLVTPTAARTPSFRQFQVGSTFAIGQTDGQVGRQVLAARPTTTPTTQDLARQDLKQIQQAYTTFGRAYQTDVNTILLAKGADGTVNTTANRAAFDAQVGTDLAALSTQVGTILGNLPSSSSLVGSVQAAINGTGSASLQSRLKALSTPSNANLLPVFLFRLRSGVAIASSTAGVSRQVLTFASNAS